MNYGTCREFNGTFAKVLEKWGYQRSAEMVRELKVSAHLLWTIQREKYFRSLPDNIRYADIVMLAQGFRQGLEGVIELINVEPLVPAPNRRAPDSKSEHAGRKIYRGKAPE